MACSKMFEVKCGAPSFRVVVEARVFYDEYLVYYLEYDPELINPANSGFDQNADFSARGAMGI